MAEPSPGQRIGNDENPNRYTLREPVKRGGEGTIWRATSLRPSGRETWTSAIKIVDAGSLQIPFDKTPSEVLTDYCDRASRARLEAAHLSQTVPQLVAPTEVFLGAEPHEMGHDLKGRCVYVVSPWVEGDDLGAWSRQRARTFTETCDVLERLAAALDAMAKADAVHRDISPGNVMLLPDEQVRLIDLTYLRPSKSAYNTVRVGTHGFQAPEATRGDFDFPADRYSFGALAFYLLAGREPATQDAAADCRAWLVRAGLGAAIARHVAALLDASPDRRPEVLSAWVAELRALGRPEGTTPRFRAFSMAIDATRAPRVAAATATGVFGARLGPRLGRRLVPDPQGPTDVVDLALVIDGAGEPVTFAATRDGRLHLGRSGEWTSAGPAVAGTGLAAVRDPYGTAVAYAIAGEEHELVMITAAPDGRWGRSGTSQPAHRVFGAATSLDGGTLVLVLSPGNELLCTDVAGTSLVCRGGAFTAAACTGPRGELYCYRAQPEQRYLEWYERVPDGWDLVETVATPTPVSAIACAGHREGTSVAIAGPDGVHVATTAEADFGSWQQVTGRPASHVALALGARWRLQLAALAEGQVALAEEDFLGNWQRRTPF